jgi:hypothetical protein
MSAGPNPSAAVLAAAYPNQRQLAEIALQKLEACQADLALTTAELRDSRLDLQAMRNSWSWRLTAPLRRLMGGGRAR